ncbi:stealth family protein [Companilactobacillus farciminis]|uniref:stealth family protein n=1 Tax=Companilactobacillus farciminis TaxID=1612 RepID=UPI0019156B9F|nr:stealth family protein [Companilactobacillus farciminis]
MEKIDFVISWVDSSDLEWQRKRQKYDSDKVIASSNGEERFRDYGTLKYLLRSIDKYADWVHKIYLVTDNQKPKWLNTMYEKLVIIDHKEILPSNVLPTFNSSAIELELDKIPNLSENFVYFNDDFLINKKVTPRDFFINGVPRDSRIYSRFIPFENFNYINMNDNKCINNLLNRKLVSLKGFFSIHYGLKGNFKKCFSIICRTWINI